MCDRDRTTKKQSEESFDGLGRISKVDDLKTVPSVDPDIAVELAATGQDGVVGNVLQEIWDSTKESGDVVDKEREL